MVEKWREHHGATAATYTTGDADVGSTLSVRVSYIDDQGTAESLTSAETASVENVNDAPSGSPLINGVLREAETLTADASGITDNDGLGTFSYQWLRNGSNIAGATGTTYSTTNADVGANLAVRITYTDVQGTVETVTSASTAAIQNINDTPNGLPLISGLATEDQTLTADISGISDDDDLGTFSYQWLRNGTNISGATNSTYTSTDADVGAAIICQSSLHRRSRNSGVADIILDGCDHRDKRYSSGIARNSGHDTRKPDAGCQYGGSL
jgi:hypothetical protein